MNDKFSAVLTIIIIAIMIIYIIGLWKVYKKVGKYGWEVIIPYYNKWVFVEISGLSPWWFFALIASSTISWITRRNTELFGITFCCLIISLVINIFCCYNISKKLHKDIGFTILMIIFPIIMIPLIGFSDKYQWDDSVEVSPNGPIGSKK